MDAVVAYIPLGIAIIGWLIGYGALSNRVNRNEEELKIMRPKVEELDKQDARKDEQYNQIIRRLDDLQSDIHRVEKKLEK
jgi:chromosome segregation ATPase